MSKFTVSIPLVSWYELEIEAESEIDARLAVARLTPSEITDKGGSYTGWDIDFSNLGVSEEQSGYCEHGTYVGGVMEDFMCGYCEAL